MLNDNSAVPSLQPDFRDAVIAGLQGEVGQLAGLVHKLQAQSSYLLGQVQQLQAQVVQMSEKEKGE